MRNPKRAKAKKNAAGGNSWVIDVDVTGNALTLSHRTHGILNNATDTMTWSCHGGKMTITWPGPMGNPFDPQPFSTGSRKNIPAGTTSAEAGSYDYTLTVFPNSNPKTKVQIDPQVEVNDGLDRKRRARRKKR